MEITSNQNGNVTVLALEGRLDYTSGNELKEKVNSEFEAGNIRVHLNLAAVDFINSSGVGTLVSLMKNARTRQGRLTLSNLAAYVSEIFEVTQLSHIFEIYPTEEAALASYESSPSRAAVR